MEKRRPKIDMEPQPLGCSSRPRKGILGEDLGSTQFTFGPSRGVCSPFRNTSFPDNSESDDELDAFSPRNSDKPFTPPRHNAKTFVKKAKSPSKAKHTVAPRFSPRARQVPKTTKDRGEDEEHKPVPSGRRPRPRPAFSKAGSYDLDAKLQPLDRPVLESKRRRKTAECDSFPLEELSPNGAKKLKTSKAHKKKAEPAPFPMNDEVDAKDKEPHSTPSTRKPVPFPVCMHSPKSSFPKRKAAQFPLESSLPQASLLNTEPLTLRPFPMEDSSCSPWQDGSDSDDELKMTENDTILTRGGPRPFPMATSQFLLGPENSKQFDKSHKPGAVPSSLEHGAFGELLLDGDENADPSTLCPYCDEPWPPAPSPTLSALLARTKRKSYADPRHGNPLGLKAPFAVFVELCQRHRFEMTHYPLALERGWPTRIDFTSLPGRIKTFRKELKRLIDQPDESKFWREVRDDAKAVGVAKVVSVTGQYATFERTQPGYYGEQGSIIIHQCLYSLFPPDTISTATILPLTPDQFLTRVLVPETALLLIQQDMRLSAEDAMHVLDESKQYGIAMFPEQEQDAKVEEIGEQLARNRAKERRKLLEERGEADADVRREVEKEKRCARKAHAEQKEKPKARKKDTVGESDTDFEVAKGKHTLDARGYPTARFAEVTHQISYKNHDTPMQDLYEDATPGPAKVTNNSPKFSTPSWRSTRSSSTSPAPISLKCSSSSLCETKRTAPLSSQSEKRTENMVRSLQWSFSLEDDHSSSGHEDAPQQETVPVLDESIMPMEDWDSEAPWMTKKIQKPKPQRKTRGQSKSQGTAGAYVVQSERIPKNEKPRCEVDVKESSITRGFQALGKTKRRKRGNPAYIVVPPSNGGTSNGHIHSWLLSDSDC